MTKDKGIDTSHMLGTIAWLIKKQRSELNLTVAQLAEKSGVSVGVISDLENNRGRVPSLANFISLAVALDLPEDMFTEFLKGNMKQITPVNCEENLKNALKNYGVNAKNMDMVMNLIDTFIASQSSTSYKRISKM